MRRVITTLLGIIALMATALPVHAGTDEPATSTRPTGDGRYATAAKLATLAFDGDTAETVIIASGDKFADGLAASYLAGVLQAPILLSPADLPFPQATLDAIDAVGATKAIIAGGTGSVSEAVEGKLKEKLGADNVDRIQGKERTETAVLLAAEGDGDVGTLEDLSGETADDLRTAVVAYAGNFPDALSVGALAYAQKYPLFLTNTEELSDLTRFALEDGTLDIEQVIIAGGPNSISDDVRDEIASLGNVQHVERIAGSGRSETAAQIADLARTRLGWDGSMTALTTGATFPDALALSPLAGRSQASILLTADETSIGAATFSSLQAVCAAATEIVVASGPRWVPDDVVDQAEAATECADRTIALAPEAETAGGEAGASGTAWFWHDTFCYAYRVDDVTGPVTAAHIHEGKAGEDGPPVAGLEAGTFTMDCVEDEDLTEASSSSTADELNTDIQDRPEDFYVNVHTEAYPAGVVRGQFG